MALHLNIAHKATKFPDILEIIMGLFEHFQTQFFLVAIGFLIQFQKIET